MTVALRIGSVLYPTKLPIIVGKLNCTVTVIESPAVGSADGRVTVTLLNARPTPNTRGLRLGNYDDVRAAIEGELELIFDGKQTVKQGLDDAVARGNAILKQFEVTHEVVPQGEI